jgi:hypothetical protein
MTSSTSSCSSTSCVKSWLGENFAGALGFGYGVIKASASTQIVAKSLEDLGNEIREVVCVDDFISAAEQGSMRFVQEKLSAFLSSASYKEKKQLWTNHASIKEIDKTAYEQNNFTPGCVYIYLQHDSCGLPVLLSLKFRDQEHVNINLDLDLEENYKKFQRYAKLKNLDYLRTKSTDQILLDAKMLTKKLKLIETPLSDKLQAIQNFNKQWKDKVTAAYSQHQEKGELVIEDSLHFINIKNSFTLVSSENLYFKKQAKAARRQYQQLEAELLHNRKQKNKQLISIGIASIAVIGTVLAIYQLFMAAYGQNED